MTDNSTPIWVEKLRAKIDEWQAKLREYEAKAKFKQAEVKGEIQDEGLETKIDNFFNEVEKKWNNLW